MASAAASPPVNRGLNPRAAGSIWAGSPAPGAGGCWATTPPPAPSWPRSAPGVEAASAALLLLFAEQNQFCNSELTG